LRNLDSEDDPTMFEEIGTLINQSQWPVVPHTDKTDRVPNLVYSGVTGVVCPKHRATGIISKPIKYQSFSVLTM
jgi:hypothetical protein